MAKVERRYWARRDRRPCEYEVYLPDLLLGRHFSLDGEVAAQVADAESALARLEASTVSTMGYETFARLLLRAEAVASSRIEGLEIGARRLLRFDAARRLGFELRDETAREVLSNIDAMTWAIEAVEPLGKITLEMLLETHRRLLSGSGIPEYGGRLRKVQNWIVGSNYHPCLASFVPPPPECVPSLMDDLIAFCNESSLPVLAQAAAAHAQFETIHPFVDGNGRTGRVLIHMILRRRALSLSVLPPVSLFLAAWVRDYVDGLIAFRYVGGPDSAAAGSGINHWIRFFAAACLGAVEAADYFAQQVRGLQSAWRDRVGPVRSDSGVNLLIEALPDAPVITAAMAAGIMGRSFPAASRAIERLAHAGVLVQAGVGRRNRFYEVPGLIDVLSAGYPGVSA